MSDEQPIRLNLGGGTVAVPGYTNIDRKTGGEAYPLTGYADGTVDAIRASHILEHFSRKQTLDVLTDWARALKPGGLMQIAVPDAKVIGRQISETIEYDQRTSLLMAYLTGGQTDENDFHQSMFTPESLAAVMKAAGLADIKPWTSDVQDCAALPISLNLQGRKGATVPTPTNAPRRVKAAALLSAPRLGFTEHMFCCLEAAKPLGLTIHKYTGAFWEQGVQNMLEKCIDDGMDWAITLDYDSIYTPGDLQTVLELMAEHPEADAVVPVQIKRENDGLLLVVLGEDGQCREAHLDEFTGDLTRVDSAHFGLTVLDLHKLATMPKPWFHSQPNEEGRWKTGRMDADTGFWRKWKQAGHTLYQANHVRLGHAQLMVTWPGEEMKPIHQYLTDWQENGKPASVQKCERGEAT